MITLLVYPGLLLALSLAAALEMGRVLVTVLRAPPGSPPVRAALADRWQAFRGWIATERPIRGTASVWGEAGRVGLALAGLLAPVAAFALLPLPGAPLLAARGTPPVGDGLAIWALLLAGPLAHGVLGLGAASMGAQLAGARRLQTALLGAVPATLALGALATLAGSLRFDRINQALGAPGTTGVGLAGLLAALALLVSLPALAGWPPADVAGVRPGPPSPESILAGLPAGLPPLVWTGTLLQRAAWSAALVTLVVPGGAATPAGPGSVGLGAAALAILVIGLAAWGARRLPPRPDQITGAAWLLGLPPALAALALALLAR